MVRIYLNTFQIHVQKKFIILGIICVIFTAIFHLTFAAEFKYNINKIVASEKMEVQNIVPADYLPEEDAEEEVLSASESRRNQDLLQIIGVFMLFSITTIAVGVLSMNLHR